LVYRVQIHRDALKVYRKLERELQTRIDAAVEKLRVDPWRRDLDVKRLHGAYAGYCRLRIGDVRVVYFVDREAGVIYIDGITHRGGAYRE
jgi:mRNA interferase RelE/StbE